MLPEALQLGLWHCLALFALSALLSVLSLRQDPMLWGARGPADVRNFIGSMTRGTRDRLTVVALVQVALVVGALGSVVLRVVELDQYTYPTVGVAVSSFLTFLGFGLHEVVVNAALAATRPGWAFVSGIVDMPGFKDRRWYLATLKRGLIPAVPVAVVVTILASVATNSWGIGRVIPDPAAVPARVPEQP